MAEAAPRDPQIELQLRHVVDGLVNHTGGALTRDRLTELVDELYDEMSAVAHIQTFVPVLVGRAALTQVRAELIAAGEVLKTMPEVLIVCQENVGRSQAAAALFRYYAPGRLYVLSAGIRPKGHVLDEVTNGLAAHGVYLTDIPKRYSPEMLAVADHLIVIGETSEPLPPVEGQDRHHWDDISQIEDLPATAVPAVLEEIDRRVRGQLGDWLPELDLGDPIMGQAASPA